MVKKIHFNEGILHFFTRNVHHLEKYETAFRQHLIVQGDTIWR